MTRPPALDTVMLALRAPMTPRTEVLRRAVAADCFAEARHNYHASRWPELSPEKAAQFREWAQESEMMGRALRVAPPHLVVVGESLALRIWTRDDDADTLDGIAVHTLAGLRESPQ